MALNKNVLPDINLDLSKIVEFYQKSNSNSTDDLVKEISSFNDYFKSMTKDINLTKVETLKEKSKVYYLFYFMSRAFFYVIMNNNFMFTKENGKVFSEFFIDYKKIIETCKLYLNQDLLLNSKNAEDNNMIIEKTEKENNNINNNDINKSIYESFQCLKKYQNEFKDAIISCQNFLIVILFSGETVEKPVFGIPAQSLDKESSNLIEIFVQNLDLFYKVNKFYGIINYTNFYNDGISKKINFKYEFITFLNNEKIRKRQQKEKEKENRKKKKKAKTTRILIKKKKKKKIMIIIITMKKWN